MGLKMASVQRRVRDYPNGWEEMAKDMELEIRDRLKMLDHEPIMAPALPCAEAVEERHVRGAFCVVVAFMMFPPRGEDPGFYLHVATMFDEADARPRSRRT